MRRFFGSMTGMPLIYDVVRRIDVCRNIMRMLPVFRTAEIFAKRKASSR